MRHYLRFLIFLSDGVYGGADNASHYKLARYSFQNPQFLFNYWAKPGFTLIIAPVAQLGFNAVRVFNVLVGVISSYLVYLIAKDLKYKNSFLIPILICFAPGYITCMMSTNTESLFILVTILAIYYFIKNKYALSVLIISFTPLFRPEAIFFIPLLGLAILLKKKFKYIPLFFTGSVLFILLGYLYFNDFIWLKRFIPYGPIESYKEGPANFFHYMNASKKIFGIPHTIFLIIGIIYLCYKLFKKNIQENKELLINKYLIIFVSFIGFYLIQSISAWKGIFTSYGPIRHVVPAIPFSALIALDGYNFIYKYIKKVPYLTIPTTILILFYLIRTPFKVILLPTPFTSEQQTVHRTSEWLKKSGYYKNKLYFYNSFFSAYNKDLNPYNYNKACYVLGIRNYNIIPKNSIILWDAHFGPALGNSLEEFKENELFKLIKVFEPDDKFRINGYQYGIYVFQKTKKTIPKQKNMRFNHCE